MTLDSAPFLGTGWSFPPAFDRATGTVRMVHGSTDVAESLLVLLSTNPGERPMMPEFGCGLRQFVFADVDANVLSSISQVITTAIERWEPRVSHVEVDAQEDAAVSGTLRITVAYTIRSTNSRYNLVFPFHAREGVSPGFFHP